MSLENPETWFMILRAGLLITAFCAFAWALRASRRESAMSFLRLSAQHAQALTEISNWRRSSPILRHRFTSCLCHRPS